MFEKLGHKLLEHIAFLKAFAVLGECAYQSSRQSLSRRLIGWRRYGEPRQLQ
jgi:hypothetical protein